ncbi:unnamed protein product [Allacma fusca]|uniref:YTH domain-containing protein n=1 Tax=Allacma fusca TaxID=39272 RepID=A0A8J2KMI4_9HEXA|nr:unnamed protein product [Allacma fusca]
MSTGVSDHQRSKGQGNSNKIYNKFPNGPKDHHGADHDDVDSWRGQQQQQQQQHHQGYASSMATTSDPYMSSYYGASFQYPATTFGVSDGGPWSTNGGDMAFLSGGYSTGMHESASGHYNIDGMFGGGNGGSFGNFGGQPGPGFGYGFHGNGDYNTWGQPQPRKHYDDYYRDSMYGDERGVKMVEQSMGGLNLNEKDHGGLKELKEMMQPSGGGGKKTTWASIASQPAKPQSLMKKKPGMPPPPIIPGTWENKNGTVAKAPIAAPVQAPHPPAWERPKVPPPTAPPQPPPSQGPVPGMQGGPARGYQSGQPHSQMGYMPSQQPHPPPPASMQQHNHSQVQPHPPMNHSTPAPPPQPPQPKYPDELKIKNEYNPPEFDMQAEGARFFVIKSYSEDDIHRSIKYDIWCSTEHGNNRLDQAYRERDGKGPVFLFFSVNGSGHFCGMAQMISAVDYEASSSVWSQDKWKGQFKVKWVYVKDVPNNALRHIKLENNENKPVTNSRDTQEVPFEKGKQVLKILHTFQHTTSIFDDFIHYEERQKEEDQRRVVHQVSPHNEVHDRGMRNERGGHVSRGGHHHGDRGGHGGPGPGPGPGGPHSNHHRDREMNNHRDNPRDPRDHRGDRDGHGRMDRNDHRGPPPDRDHYGGGRSFDRDFHPRDRDHRGGGRGRGPPRN